MIIVLRPGITGAAVDRSPVVAAAEAIVAALTGRAPATWWDGTGTVTVTASARPADGYHGPRLECGWCGTSAPIPGPCPHCGGTAVRFTAGVRAPAVHTGDDAGGLPPLPGHDGPGHTPAGPAGCPRCALLRANSHWITP